MRLETKFSLIQDLNSFNTLIEDNQIQTKIGFFGGRKFKITGFSGQTSLNLFYITFKRIYYAEKDDNNYLVAEKILNNLRKVDTKGSAALRSASIWKRILTKIKSLFGAISFERKNESLALGLRIHATKLTHTLEKIGAIKQIFDEIKNSIIPRIERLEKESPLLKFCED